MTKTKHKKIPTIMGGGCPEYNKMDKIRCKSCNQLMEWNKPHICLQLFERNWIKGEVTSVTKFWKDKEEFAPFYKDDLMSFKERHFEEGYNQARKEELGFLIIFDDLMKEKHHTRYWNDNRPIRKRIAQIKKDLK